MTIEQIVGILGQLATWITVILVFFTLREMEKQRKASQKPELIVPNMPIYGYADKYDIFIATRWSNKEIKDGEDDVRRYPNFIIYNIGTGSSKEINIKWDFNVFDCVKYIQDYCYRNSLPVVVSTQNDVLEIEYKGRKSHTSLKADFGNDYAYLLPASVTSQGLKANLPFAYLNLLSILIFLDVHKSQNRTSNKTALSTEEPVFEIPQLSCELSYVDIGGEKYVKSFEISFQPFVLTTALPSKQADDKGYEQVFQGMLEFKESK